jgi:DNA-binding transcriptional ArsR family regulator
MATKKDQATEADQATERTLTDPAMIRALTHPTRLTIMERLGDTGASATATELAEVVGLSPSATSYHLRALASWGLVEEAEGRGDGRERRWRVIGRGLTLDADPGAGPDFREAARGLVAVILARADEQFTRWFAREADEPAEWADAVSVSNTRLLVTAAELAEINAAYRELLRPYLRRTRTDPPAGARVVSAHFRAVPSG